jgi:hypothetical protein
MQVMREKYMKVSGKRDAQRGVALFLTVFALLLLSGIAIAMLYSSDTETTISVNYRDKQGAVFGVLAGLQEARARIHPLTGDLGPGTNLSSGGLNIVPTALPSTSAANVLYIINPAAGETVAPWDPTNKYFDTELCQETYFVNNLGVTAGTPGTPCPATSASVPSGTAWYSWYDNSQKQAKSGATGSGDAAVLETAYQLKDSGGSKIPLNYKWVRVQLKADNMTPVTVGTGNGTQVCWNGSHEQQISAGYHTDCTPPAGGVTAVTVTASGSGYASVPTVSITGGGGSGATATASIVLLPTGITSVTLTNPGAGYTSVPAVTITPSDGNGGGAAVNAALNNTVPVQSVSWSSATPACYAVGTKPTVSFSPAGATATATMTGNTCIYGFAASGSCTSKNVTATVTASNGTGTVAFSGSVTSGSNKKADGSYTPSNPGNYTTVPSTFSVASPCSSVTIAPTYGIQISTINVTAGGSYQAGTPPAVSLSGATPVGGTPSATATLAAGASSGTVAALTIPSGGNGSGYTANPSLTIAPPCTPLSSCGGIQATGTASITPSYGVSGIQVTNAGSGYSQNNPPTVTISGGGGATGVASVGSGGSYKGQVYLLTSLAVTQSGARAMLQAETAVNYNQFTMGLGGALTLIGPNPVFGTPNSNPFHMIGTDCPTCASAPPGCNTTARPPKDAIGIYDPTGATDPSAVQTVIGELGKPNNYIGANSTPDVANANLGSMTASDLNSFVSAVTSVATNVYGSNPGSINLGTAANPPINVVNGDYSMGSSTGYGILVVTGTLTFSGNYSFNGLILVIGAGASVMNGGGNGQINGSVFVANTAGGTINPPSASWSGGGGNGIQYNHCWADDMLARVPYTPVMSPNGLQIVSLRNLVY